MARELRFDVSALDQASRTFARMAQAVDRFERRLDRLDGKRVTAEAEVKTDRAERAIGQFAETARRRLQSALTSLPEVELDANSSPLDRKLADVRRRMAELADKTIGVDIDADEALREAQQLQRELDELSRTHPRVDVRVNAAHASRELDELNDQVDQLDGRTAVVKVRTDGSILDSTRHITRLGAAMRAIAIPSAVLVGTPALVSLGGSAAVAAGSLGLVPAAANAAGLAVGTLVTAFQHFGDAIGDDPEKAAEALAKLTPAARSAATEVNKLDPAFRKIRESVQETFFSGLGERLGELGGRWMPMLEGATTRVADQFSTAADQVLQFAGHSKTVATFRDQFLDLGTAVGNLTPAIMPLTSVMTDVGTVGAKVLADITGGAGEAAAGLAEMVSQARHSGQMEAGIRRGLTELRRFGQLAGNTGGILRAMYDAGRASGNHFLGTLIDVTGRMDDFLSSAQGQAAMVQIFTGMNDAVTALLPGLEAVGSAVGEIATDKATSGALTAMAGAFSDLLVAAAPTAVAISRVVTLGIQPFAAALSFAAPLIGPLVGGLLAMKAASSAMNFLAAATGLKTLGTAAATATTGLRNTAAAAATMGTAGRTAAGGLAGTAAAAATMSRNAGGAAEGTGRVATALGRVQSVAGKVGSALPLVGLGFIAADTAVRAMTVSLSDAMTAYGQGGTAAEEMRRKVEEQTLAFGPNQNAFERAGNTALDWIRSNVFGVATVDDFNASIEEQNRLMHESVAATGVSRSSFDEITGSMDRSKEAAQQVSDSLALVGPALAGMKDGVAPTREMDDALKGVATSAGEASQQAGESAAKLGGVAAGATAAANSMQASRDAFIASAQAAGMSEEAAGKLADQIGLIPDAARTNFETNAATTAMEITQVRDKLAEVPLGKAVTVTAMTDTAKSALTTLGLQVETMKDGTVRVTADTQEAQNNLNSFIAGSQDKKTTITIDGQAQPAQSALNSILGAIRAGRETVTIDGQTQPVLQALSYVLGTVGGAQGEVTIGAQTMPADTALGHYLAAVNSADGTVKIGAETFTADQILAAFISRAQSPVTKPLLADPSDVYAKEAEVARVVTNPATKPMHGDPSQGLTQEQRLAAQVRTPSVKAMMGDPNPGLGSNAALAAAVAQPATKPIDADPSRANAKIHGVVGLANQSTGTLTIDGNPTMANGKITTAVRFADGSRGTITVDANEQPANGRIRATVTYADRSTGTVTVNANDTAARNAISNLQRPTYSTHTVRIATVGRIADGNVALARANRALGAYTTPGITPYAQGGYRSMSASRAEIVPPRHMRLIGDRMVGDEAFIPINRSKRSRSILARTAHEMGYSLAPVKAMANGGMLSAARAILGRMQARQPLAEDWTWKGAPAVVGQHNDALLDEMRRRGYRYADARRFFEDYIRQAGAASVRPTVTAAHTAQVQAVRTAQASAASAQSSATAGVAELRALIAEARAHTGLLRALRSDFGRGQGLPELAAAMSQLGKALADAKRLAATARGAGARDTAAFGGW
ncbi:hypothetical protein [Pseudonocardia sp. NPDC049635]|uniref:hypothetical protein n=1 Tax=Pseudonocardia sp. NPDC049635 TaxID=3155506 RepID=UPI0033E77767